MSPDGPTAPREAPARYLHTQVGWAMIGVVVPVAVLTVWALGSAGLHAVAIPVALVLLALLATFGWLTVGVDERELQLRFGLGLVRKRVPLQSIRSYRVVKNRWWYGWGIRLTPHGTLWNVSGLDAVELLLDGPKKLRVGTDEPGALLRALERFVGEARPLEPGEDAAAERRARRTWVALLGVALLIGLGIGALLWAEARPPKAWVDDGGFHAESAVYSAHVPLAAITHVSLEGELPRILARTNGTALGRTLRGNFRVDRLGDGKLFLTAGRAPYVLVRHSGGFVMVGFDEPERTRALHAALLARRP
jgi:hypothetical protein